MKRLLGLLLACSFVVPIGCGGEPPKPALKWRFEQGTKLRYRVTSDTSTASPMFSMKQSQELESTFVTTGVTEEGIVTVQVTVDNIKIHMENPMMGNVDYDSTAPDAAETARGNPLSQAMAAMIGEPLTLTLDESGRIHSLTGGAAMADSLQLKGPMGEQLKALFDDDRLKSQFEAMLGSLPTEKMAAGATWNEKKTRPGPMGVAVKMDLIYTVTSIEEIEGVTIGTIAFKTGEGGLQLIPPEPDPKSPMAADMSQLRVTGGDLTGETRFDMSNGRLLSSTTEIAMKLSMGGMELESESSVKTELIE